MSANASVHYGYRLAIVYAIVWFVDLLDSTSLNVAITAIASSFGILPQDAEWVIIGFFFSMTVGISVSGWLGDSYGMKKVFLFSQILYLISSLACGFSINLQSLVLFRSLQGFAGGLAIPLGLASLLKVLPKHLWAKTTANINVVTLLAPALGPIFGVYASETLGWQSIFFLKIPLSIAALILSMVWVRNEPASPRGKFDWSGFITGSAALIGLLWVFSEAGKGKGSAAMLPYLGASLLLGYLFIQIEKRKQAPLVPLGIFRVKRYAVGNLIQSSANAIFLGASFIIALYLQDGLGHSLVESGWVMACISPGMILAQPFLGRYYNRVGAMPFMLAGLSLLALSMAAFVLTTASTPLYLLGAIVFIIGAASSLAQSSNVVGIFASLADDQKGVGSSLYSLFKQLSASFGVALSALVFTFAGGFGGTLYAYQCCFIVLAMLPAAGLLCCSLIREKRPLTPAYDPE